MDVSLRGSFILPIGEHLLKIVEQLEMVAAWAGESLQSVGGEEGEEWKPVITEMNRYGVQEEKKRMTTCELALKHGCVDDGGRCDE